MARTICKEVYLFNELSLEAQQKAIAKYRDNYEYHYYDADKSINEFCELFNIKLRGYDWGNKTVDYSIYHLDDNMLELSDKRLLSYLWNTKHRLWDKRYLKASKEHVKQPNLRHPMVKWNYINNKSQEPFYYKSYESNLSLETGCCLTGCCYDNWITEPIYDLWLKYDKDITLKELIRKCMNNFIKLLAEDYEYCMSDENLTEEITANDYEFYENGEMI